MIMMGDRADICLTMHVRIPVRSYEESIHLMVRQLQVFALLHWRVYNDLAGINIKESKQSSFIT